MCPFRKISQIQATEIHQRRVHVLNIKASRRASTIIVELLRPDGTVIAPLIAIPDCAAEATIMGLKQLHLLGEDVNNLDHRGTDSLVAANGLSVELVGRVTVSLRYGKQVSTTPVIVCPEYDGMLVSWFTCIDLGILPKDFPEPILSSISQVRSSSSDAVRQFPIDLMSTDFDRLTDIYRCPGPIDSIQIPAINEAMLSVFSDVFDETGPLKQLDGPAMTIELNPDAIPFAVHGCRPIPFAQREPAKILLDDMVAQNIIEPVTEPTDWVHPLVVELKGNGTVRICVDLSKLNCHVRRPLHPLVTPKDAVSSVPPSAQ